MWPSQLLLVVGRKQVGWTPPQVEPAPLQLGETPGLNKTPATLDLGQRKDIGKYNYGNWANLEAVLGNETGDKGRVSGWWSQGSNEVRLRRCHHWKSRAEHVKESLSFIAKKGDQPKTKTAESCVSHKSHKTTTPPRKFATFETSQGWASFPRSSGPQWRPLTPYPLHAQNFFKNKITMTMRQSNIDDRRKYEQTNCKKN